MCVNALIPPLTCVRLLLGLKSSTFDRKLIRWCKSIHYGNIKSRIKSRIKSCKTSSINVCLPILWFDVWPSLWWNHTKHQITHQILRTFNNVTDRLTNKKKSRCLWSTRVKIARWWLHHTKNLFYTINVNTSNALPTIIPCYYFWDDGDVSGN